MKENTEAPMEQVLVIPRSEFTARGAFNGFRDLSQNPDLGEYLQSAPNRIAGFIPRDEAERDPNYKQIIPYIALVFEGRVLVYQRGVKGAEERLHGDLSVGIGGHVNTGDDPEEPFWAFAHGAIREIAEEVGLKIDHDRLQSCVEGLINNDEDSVGAVHLGVAMVLQIDEQELKSVLATCEQSMVNPRFIPIEHLHENKSDYNFETWSSSFVDHLMKHFAKGGKWEDADFRERVQMMAITASNLASASAGFLMQDSHAGHETSKGLVEEAAGRVQCMLSGLVHNDDISSDNTKKSAVNFLEQMGSILKHQKGKKDA